MATHLGAVRLRSLREAHVGIRKREWTAMAATKEAVPAEMASCLAQIREGRVPKQSQSASSPGNGASDQRKTGDQPPHRDLTPRHC
jgi:hypothetical protein